ncbi:hypothetical protein KKG45_00930 [bacterium]|nr:hypothetical protein [bacterium]MBU1071789.1 hypothetical protein [bacterium]MBU1674486.1 hypothetical protein [bacterium]
MSDVLQPLDLVLISLYLVGLAGDAYATGFSVFNHEWMAAVVLVFAGVFFLPQLLRSGVSTLPEFPGRRHGAASRRYFKCPTLFLNIIVDTAASLYAGALLTAVSAGLVIAFA